jgi:hypothetical protein
VAHKSVLLELDPDLLGRLDAFWPSVGYPSRRAAIRAAIEQQLAARAAYIARERAATSPWHQGWSRPGTPDDRAAEASRPLTADLAELL